MAERQDVPAGQPSVVRKLIHVALSIVPVAGWRISYPVALGLAGLLLLASILIEVTRRWWPGINRLLWTLLPTTFRSWEGRRVLGSTWYSLGMAATFALWGRDAGGTAVLFLAWGDPAAELVGRTLGRSGKRKTVAGSAGCLAACLIAGVAGVAVGGLSPATVLVGAVVATLVERWSPPPDDNLWMPFVSGGAMAVVQWLTGG
jgi:dolichol kinase